MFASTAQLVCCAHTPHRTPCPLMVAGMYSFVSGEVARRFDGNPDCVNAYKNFLCFLNFPRCDKQRDSLLLCTSVCENFFRSCNYPRALWRCYEPRYYGAKKAEGTDGDQEMDLDGLPVYLRALLPGLPFKRTCTYDTVSSGGMGTLTHSRARVRVCECSPSHAGREASCPASLHAAHKRHQRCARGICRKPIPGGR